jgi:hypothetical protein
MAIERSLRKNPNLDKVIKKDLFEYELFGVYSQVLETMIPPKTSSYAMSIYQILTNHITLSGGQMGVSFRESKSDIINILKSYDIDYRVAKPFVDEYEYRLSKQFQEEMDKQKG